MLQCAVRVEQSQSKLAGVEGSLRSTRGAVAVQLPKAGLRASDPLPENGGFRRIGIALDETSPVLERLTLLQTDGGSREELRQIAEARTRQAKGGQRRRK